MPRPPHMPPTAPQPTIGADGRILEGLVTTIDDGGGVHLAPMGPIVDERMERLWLRPFRTSTTFRHLRRSRAGVFHVTDDVELIARAAIGRVESAPAFIPAEKIAGAILADACRWYAFEIESLDESTDRTSLVTRVVDTGVQREFLGFNRAKHAVIEAAILATRIHVLDAEHVLAEFERLAVPVAKTGAAAEVRAFDLLRTYTQERLATAYAR